MRILVTGAGGFIGARLVKRLAAKGHEVLSWGRAGAQDFVFRGDLRDASLRRRAVSRVDWVFHLGAVTSVPECEANPIESHQTNCDATLDLMRDFRELGARTSNGLQTGGFIFASSSAVYGDLSKDAISESDEAIPVSHYGKQKLEAERRIRELANELDVPALCLRFFNVYGPGQPVRPGSAGVVGVFFDRAQRGLPLKLFGGGLQTRDFLYIDDAVDACVKVLGLAPDRLSGQAINIASGHSVTIKELAELCRQYLESSSPIEHHAERVGDAKHSSADVSLAEKLLGFRAKHDLVSGLSSLGKESR